MLVADPALLVILRQDLPLFTAWNRIFHLKLPLENELFLIDGRDLKPAFVKLLGTHD